MGGWREGQMEGWRETLTDKWQGEYAALFAHSGQDALDSVIDQRSIRERAFIFFYHTLQSHRLAF